MSPKRKRGSKKVANEDLAAMPLLAECPDTTKKAATWFVAALAVGMALTFLLCWRFQFTSDSVLTPLMARSILTRGERPLFVWSVGYQGVLINAYMNALMFKLFGFGVYQINFWPTLAYLSFTALFVAYVRRGVGDLTALATGIFFIISNPVLCTGMMRNVPNYPETFAMGIALFLLERRLLQQHYVERKPLGPRSWGEFALIGLVCGFGAYTYGQIYLFIASVAAHLALLYVHDVIHSFQTHPNHWRVVGCIATLPCMVVAMGLWHFCTGSAPAAAFAPFVGSNGIAVLERGFAALAALSCVEIAVRRRSLVVRLLPGIGCMGLGAVAGYAPALWEFYGRMRPIVNKASVSGDLQVWLHRAWLGLQGNMWHLNLVPTPELSEKVHFNILATFGTVGILGAFVVFSVRHFWAFLVRPRPASPWVIDMGPILLLPLINIVVFGLSDAVVNEYSSRYTLSAWLFYALAFGWFLATALQKAPRMWGWGAVALAIALLCNNANAIRRDLSVAVNAPFDGEDTIPYLDSQGITRGYASYWSAYTINFFTNERIILQPLNSAYCPHYGPEVARADKIAVVARPENLQRVERGSQVQWFNEPWIVDDYWRGARAAVVTLDRPHPKQTAIVQDP